MDGIFPIVGGALWGTQGFFFGAVDVRSSNPARDGTAATTTRTPSNAHRTRSRCSSRTSIRENGGTSTSTRPRPTRNGATHWGDYYLDIQDARDLYYRVMAAGSGWVGDTPGFNGDLNAALGSIKAKRCSSTTRATSSYLPHHIEAQVKAIPNARAVAIDSVAGHLICCNADPQATWAMGEAIRGIPAGAASAVRRKAGRVTLQEAAQCARHRLGGERNERVHACSIPGRRVF